MSWAKKTFQESEPEHDSRFWIGMFEKNRNKESKKSFKMTIDPTTKNSRCEPKGALYVPGMEETWGTANTLEQSLSVVSTMNKGISEGVINEVMKEPQENCEPNHQSK